MTTRRLYLREAGTPETEDSVLLSTVPTARAVLMTGATGMSKLDFCATWFMAAVPFGSADAKLTGEGTYPQFVVPATWYANLYLMTVQTYDNGTDITSCAVRLWVSNQDASDGVINIVTIVPDDVAAVRGSCALVTAGVLTSPYIVTTSPAAGSYFDPRVTTDGAAGTMNVLVRIFGYLYQPL